VLAVTIAVLLAHTSWSLWTLARMPAIPGGAARPATAAHRPPEAGELIAAHLFGKAPEAAAEAPSASLAQWVLTGTLAGGSPNAGAAILGRTVGTTRLFAAGQQVDGGFRLAEVFADRVTLERAGERISLTLPRTSQGSTALANTRLVATAAVPAARSPEERLRERPQNQSPALLELRPSLHRGIGRFDGMRVWGTGDGSNLVMYGLRRNDIIREVDGAPINTTTAEYRALDALSRGRPVAITVERGGNVFTLHLGFAEAGS